MLSISRPFLTCDENQVLRHQFLEASQQLKEQMVEAFDKDDRYCATGDEKYYLDLPGKENEKVPALNLVHIYITVLTIVLAGADE